MRYLFLLLISLNSYAYTFNNNFAARFKDNEVKITIDELTTCSGMSIYELEDIIKDAVNDFWNIVPTSSLKIVPSGFSSATTNINSGILCSPTDETCITNAGGNLIPTVKNIVVACNTEGDNFGNSTEVLAVAIPNKFDGKNIVGSIVLINDNSSTFFNLPRAKKVAVLAHEIGHAIGLGHSEDSAALMYYKVVPSRKSLGQDDMRGVSYPYPIFMDLGGLLEGGLLGGCGTISTDRDPPQGPHLLQMGLALSVLIVLFELRKLFKRSKARASA
jgi:hypothetical protein